MTIQGAMSCNVRRVLSVVIHDVTTAHQPQSADAV